MSKTWTNGKEAYETYCDAMGGPRQQFHLLPSVVQDAWRAVAGLSDGAFEQGYEQAIGEVGGYRDVTCPKCAHEFEEYIDV